MRGCVFVVVERESYGYVVLQLVLLALSLLLLNAEGDAARSLIRTNVNSATRPHSCHQNENPTTGG